MDQFQFALHQYLRRHNGRWQCWDGFCVWTAPTAAVAFPLCSRNADVCLLGNCRQVCVGATCAEKDRHLFHLQVEVGHRGEVIVGCPFGISCLLCVFLGGFLSDTVPCPSGSCVLLFFSPACAVRITHLWKKPVLRELRYVGSWLSPCSGGTSIEALKFCQGNFSNAVESATYSYLARHRSINR